MILYFAVCACKSIHLCMFLSLLSETLCGTAEMCSFSFPAHKGTCFLQLLLLLLSVVGCFSKSCGVFHLISFPLHFEYRWYKTRKCSIGMRDYLQLNNNHFCFITREFYSKSQSSAGTWSSKNKLPWWLGHAVWYVSIFFLCCALFYCIVWSRFPASVFVGLLDSLCAHKEWYLVSWG